jgi:hypothetical protein
VSRQAVIKTLVRQGLDQRYLARHARQTQSRSRNRTARGNSPAPG